MKVTYIVHSGFLVELEQKYLLFDYYKGTLPELKPEKPLYIFASHAHQDHFNPEIFRLEEQHPQTTYILSYDIKIKAHQIEKWHLKENVLEKIQTVRAQHRYLLAENGQLQDRGEWRNLKSENTEISAKIEICTLKSTDAGVAFLVRTEGKTIYHAGDLNWWYWEGESKQCNHNMTANFCREIDKMTDVSVDLAFLPLDSRQGEAYRMGFDYMLKKAKVKVAFPMHMWEDYGVIQKFKEESDWDAYDTTVMDIEREGQEWDIFTFLP